MDNLMMVNDLRHKLNDEMPPTVIDVRAPEAYEKGHLPTAINIPRDDLVGHMDEIPMDRFVVTYCDMHKPGDSRSESAAEQLREAGYHARALQGGYPEWVESGYPIETETTMLK